MIKNKKKKKSRARCVLCGAVRYLEYTTLKKIAGALRRVCSNEDMCQQRIAIFWPERKKKKAA